MDFFSGSVPNLVSNKSIKNIENITKITNPIKETNITDTVSNIYENIIKPNMFLFSIILILALFLLYKYFTKESILSEDYEENKNNLTDDLYNSDDNDNYHNN